MADNVLHMQCFLSVFSVTTPTAKNKQQKKSPRTCSRLFRFFSWRSVRPAWCHAHPARHVKPPVTLLSFVFRTKAAAEYKSGDRGRADRVRSTSNMSRSSGDTLRFTCRLTEFMQFCFRKAKERAMGVTLDFQKAEPTKHVVCAFEQYQSFCICISCKVQRSCICSWYDCKVPVFPADWVPSLWRDIFDELLYDDNELDYGDQWSLNFNYSQTDTVTKEDRKRGWKVFCHRAYGEYAFFYVLWLEFILDRGLVQASS